jgi:fatty acid synthase subunit beta, fungi type
MEVNGATVPVLQDLKPRSKSYIFSNPTGLLFSIQFAQPAISLVNLAETAALENRSLIPDNVFFVGHSLGEYSSLSGCAGVFSV